MPSNKLPSKMLPSNELPSSNKARKGPTTAVALGYDPAKDTAPRILAAGRGELAEAMLAMAERHHVPVYEDHPLADALVKLEIGAHVPPELYRAVAEVISFLWTLERERSRSNEEAATHDSGHRG